MDQEILRVSFYDVVVCSSYAFLRLERSILRLRQTAIENITAKMPQTVCNELDYRVDICRITKSAHIEHL
jgi:hypothetical protein